MTIERAAFRGGPFVVGELAGRQVEVRAHRLGRLPVVTPTSRTWTAIVGSMDGRAPHSGRREDRAHAVGKTSRTGLRDVPHRPG